MSLLLEALKKAEKAKEEAQRRARGGDAGGDAVGAASPDPDATVAAEGRHVMTRDELPDISAPLEILSDDIRPAAAKKPAPLELSIADSSPPPPPEPKAAAPRRDPAAGRAAANAAAESANAERASAQRVFEAKFKEPNPRLPFYITVGVLGTFAIGTVIYFWLQLRPAPSLVNANPIRPAGEVAADKAAPAPGAAPATSVASAQSPATALPGLPSTTPAAAPAPAPAEAPAKPAAAPAALAPVAASAAAKPAPEVTPAPAKPAARAASASRARSEPGAPAPDRSLSVNRGGPTIHPQVQSGYTAYQAGDLAKARADYQQAMRDDPSNRDALLGMAAVEMRSGRYDLADGLYQRILQMDPRDPAAQAGMFALRSQQLDPVQVESRVKSMLASDRESNVLNFTLGNQYAAQGRWAEAQQSYFKAFAIDPENPDFAFNLAVSLDQLRQPRLALEYYRRALALAEKRTASFSPETARTRIQQISQAPAR